MQSPCRRLSDACILADPGPICKVNVRSLWVGISLFASPVLSLVHSMIKIGKERSSRKDAKIAKSAKKKKP